MTKVDILGNGPKGSRRGRMVLANGEIREGIFKNNQLIKEMTIEIPVKLDAK